MTKVIVGMSGGVDSSVTAHLLKEKGYEVEGLSFIMRATRKGTAPSYCSLQAMEEVSKTARYIGIPHKIIDVREDFIEKVIEPFVDSYIRGSTPNPCVLCNRFIKFPFLVKEAGKRGAEYIATGHYARVEPAQSIEHGAKSIYNEVLAKVSNGHPPQPLPSREGLIYQPSTLAGEGKGGGVNGLLQEPHNDSTFNFQLSNKGDELPNMEHIPHYLLKKGVDPKKDQSYVLYVLRQEELKRLILPLGYYKKEEVRKIAKELDLPAAGRSESQEICFIEDRKYFTFIEKLSPFAGKSGPIVDLNGKAIGTHKGIHGYTIGQRKGLGISSPEPLYVVKIDVSNNTIYAGPSDTAKKKEFFVKGLNWINPPTPLIPPLLRGELGGLKFRASVRVRSTMKDEPATIYIAESMEQRAVQVVFDEPQWAPAPGQSAVFYDGDTVIGGGVIM